jgi:hypothetical protein
MDTAIIWTTITGFLTCTGTTIGLFIWASHKSDANALECRQLIEANSLENRRLIEASSLESRNLIASIHKEIQQEMKDFHGRLCTIEERYRNR